jgi:predicted SAM-dependent methyltransferase
MPVSPDAAPTTRPPDALHKNVARPRALRRRIGRHWQPTHGVRLNLGCGSDYREGWINLDQTQERADVGHDLTQVPWPFDHASVDWVFADQVLEHLPPKADGRDTVLLALGEIQRTFRPGGRLYVGVPWSCSPIQVAG